MSLRARLVIGLLALAALGLLVAGAVTYAEQKSFQLDRVDQQAHAALPSVSRELDDEWRERAGIQRRRAAAASGGGPRVTRAVAGGGPPGAAVSLPPGTYGQRRDANGKVLGNVVFSYGQRHASRRPRSPPT